MEPTATGNLGATPFAHLLLYCLERTLSGSLLLQSPDSQDDEASDFITLLQGQPAKVRVADPVAHLGRVLIELGLIDDSTARSSRDGVALHGQSLVAQGALDEETLIRALRSQIEKKLEHIFTRPATTRFYYFDGKDLLAGYGAPELFPVDPTRAVWNGVRAHPPRSHIDKMLEQYAETPIWLKSSIDVGNFSLSSTHTERDLLRRLQGGCSLPRDLPELGGLTSEVCEPLLYALLLLKLVEPAPEGTRRATSQDPIPQSQGPSALGRVRTRKVNAAEAREMGGGDGRDDLAPKSKPGEDPKISARRSEIKERVLAIDKETYFQMLGVESAATADAIKSAYFALAKRWHPDRLPAELIELRPQVARIFSLLSEAHNVLSDETQRVKYAKVTASGGGTPEDQREVQRLMEASSSYQKAEFFLGKSQLVEAMRYIERAIELAPDEPSHVALHCWLLVQRPGSSAEELLKRLDVAVASSPNCEPARFYRGMIRKLANRGDAIEDFQAVAKANPKHTEAARELRLFEMRSAAKEAPGTSTSGLFGKLLKRK